MKYRTTRETDRDIIDIYVSGVEEFGVAQSERYVGELFATFDILAGNPHMARERMELNPPTRLHPYQAHMIAYLIRENDILIVRVLHGRQNWQGLFV